MTENRDCEQSQAIEDEIAELRRKLHDAETRLNAANGNTSRAPPPSLISNNDPPPPSPSHFLLLLSDSALPLGSFAFSSGLESYLAHTRPPSFPTFLHLSLSSHASTTLPYLLAAHRRPQHLPALDDALDASTICTVARRASVAQGRALLSVWERAFRHSVAASPEVLQILADFSTTLRMAGSAAQDLPPASAHLAPLFGVIARAAGVGDRETAYVYMLGHVKALLSAAVRASVFGPYQAQRLLASREVQEGIGAVIEREWGREVEEAGQTVPVVDLWVGRHELLYSRIFNS